MSAKTSISLATISALAVLTLGTGCIEDYRGFVIMQNQVPTAGCLVTTTATIYRPRGILDVSAKQGYWLYPLMANNLPSTKAEDKEPERNVLYMKGYEVEVDLGQIPGQFSDDMTDFWQRTSGNLAPLGNLAGQAKVLKDSLVTAFSIPPGVLTEVTVSVRAVASHGGRDKESATFVYPIDLCNGCLVDNRTTCPTSKDSTVKKNYCGTPQDVPVTCCPVAGRITCISSTTQ